MMTETCRLLCIVVYVLTLQLISGSTAASTPPPQVGNSSTSCNTTCGRVSIPFPFGIGRKECYLNSWFEVVCKTINTSGSSVTTVPFLSRLNREVVNISFPMNQKISDGRYGVVHIKGPVTSLGCTSQVSGNSSQVLNVTGRESPYFITDDNRLVAARIPLEGPQVIGFSMENSNGTSGEGCRVAFLSNSMYSPANVREPEQFHSDGYAVVQLGWFSVFDASDSRSSNFWGCFKSTTAQSYMTNTSCFCYNGDFSGMSYTNCYCASGYIGNPYIQSGCTDDDACKSPDICGEGETCENAPGLGYRCNPKPKIIKPDKTPVLQGECPLFNYKPG
uniref:Wall-associated receptor kinase galacturonan-binding domain-containing protein n=1 Tax=Brassica oleracea var. oleracea TaxID=109376 RepID=A0A0D3CAP4_BRAOL